MSDLKTGVQRNIKQQMFSTAYFYTATILSLLLITGTFSLVAVVTSKIEITV
jgi:hypothetical protein